MLNNLPHSEILEAQFIGQSILDARKVTHEAEPADFYNHEFRQAWSAICDLDRDGKEIDAFAIADRIKSQGGNVSIGRLAEAATGLIYDGDISKYVRQLKDLSARRVMLRDLESHTTRLQDQTCPIEATLELLAERIQRLSGGLNGSEMAFQPLAEIIDLDVKPALDDLVLGQAKKIATGFPELDKNIGGGLALSDVVLVVSDTGNGKSAFVLQLADQIAKQGFGVAYVSGEMRNRENVLRLLSQNATMTNLNSVVRISGDERDTLTEWADHIKNRPIFFDHSSGDLQTVKRNLKALIAKHSIKVLILDYIQLYRLTPNDKMGRVERLTEVSQEVKRIANEFGIIAIEVAQFNREGAKSEKAGMHHLEGSGQLEKDCSLIFIIDRETDSDRIALRIDKGRNSGKCQFSGTFAGRTLTFSL